MHTLFHEFNKRVCTYHQILSLKDHTSYSLVFEGIGPVSARLSIKKKTEQIVRGLTERVISLEKLLRCILPVH